MASREDYLIEQARLSLSATPAQVAALRPAYVPPVIVSSPGVSPTLMQVFRLSRINPSQRSWISGLPNEVVRPNNAPQEGSGGGFSGSLRNALPGW